MHLDSPTATTDSPRAAHSSTADHFALDTTGGSILHWLLPFRTNGVSSLMLYLVAIAIVWLPLAIAWLITGQRFVPAGAGALEFYEDWGYSFTFLLSFPCIFVLALTDQSALSEALRSVQLDQTLVFRENKSAFLVARWQSRFRMVNAIGYLAGTVVGCLVAYFNYITYIPESVGYWISYSNRLLPTGWIYLYSIWIFYAVVTIYIFRNMAVALLFRDIVSSASLQLLPMHPDKSGGLHPIGRLGLRNQYVLMLLGLNIVAVVIFTALRLKAPKELYELLGAAVAAYLVIGPLIFIAPLLPFRTGMLKTKSELMASVAKRLRVELRRIQAQLGSAPITKEDEELVDRLRKIASVVDELPVWPFDASTLRKFLTAYVVPVATTAAFPLLKALFELTKGRLLW